METRAATGGRPYTENTQVPSAPCAAAHYFDDFLARRIGGPLLPGVAGVDVIFEIRLTDQPGFRRTVVVEDGRLHAVAEAGPTPHCTYTLDSAVFRRIAAGRLDPRDAFFARRTQILGDIEAGLRVASLMIDFFRQNPYAELAHAAA
jgi:putative sterol carrier protein